MRLLSYLYCGFCRTTYADFVEMCVRFVSLPVRYEHLNHSALTIVPTSSEIVPYLPRHSKGCAPAGYPTRKPTIAGVVTARRELAQRCDQHGSVAGQRARRESNPQPSDP